METLRPNAHRAKLAIILIWVVLGAEILALVSEVIQYLLLQDMLQGIEITEAQKLSNDKREGLIILFHTLVFIISMVTFIQWFRRAYYNLGLLTKSLSSTDGWTAASWFIPFYNWFRPYQLMKEMFNETYIVLKSRVDGFSSPPQVKTVGVWWTFWIISNILGNLVFRIENNAIEIKSMMAASLCNILLGFLAVPLALITVRMIKEYTVMEAELHNIPPLSANDPWMNMAKDSGDQ